MAFLSLFLFLYHLPEFQILRSNIEIFGVPSFARITPWSPPSSYVSQVLADILELSFIILLG